MNTPNNQHIEKEQKLLVEAIIAVTQLTGAHIKLLGAEIREGNKTIDAKINFEFRAGQQEFNVKIKGEVRSGILPQVLEQFGKNKEQWLFVSQYIPGPTKEEFRNNGINYLEVAGNCFINTGQLFLFVNDKEVKQARKKEGGKLWTASGLKLLFFLLQYRTDVSLTYRELSHAADIALGSIRTLLDDIKEEGWSDNQNWMPGQPVDLHKERLAIRWAEIFPAVLRPKLKLGKFRFLAPDTDWPKQLPEGCFWGGEPAGELYTGQLVPQTFTLYTDRPTNELVKKLRIVPDPNGNITIFKKFWREFPGLHVIQSAAPPLLAYAELRNSNDSRCWEIAERIKNEYITIIA